MNRAPSIIRQYLDYLFRYERGYGDEWSLGLLVFGVWGLDHFLEKLEGFFALHGMIHQRMGVVAARVAARSSVPEVPKAVGEELGSTRMESVAEDMRGEASEGMRREA